VKNDVIVYSVIPTESTSCHNSYLIFVTDLSTKIHCDIQGVDFINICTCSRLFSQTRTAFGEIQHSCLAKLCVGNFSLGAKKFGVNFINILLTNFSNERCFGSFFYVHVTRKKLTKQRLYKKFVCKMLMKLTEGVQKLKGIWLILSQKREIICRIYCDSLNKMSPLSNNCRVLPACIPWLWQLSTKCGIFSTSSSYLSC